MQTLRQTVRVSISGGALEDSIMENFKEYLKQKLSEFASSQQPSTHAVLTEFVKTVLRDDLSDKPEDPL